MARTALGKQSIVQAGLIPAYSAANADGHSIAGSGNVFLHVKNGGGAPINVTVQTPATVAGLAVTDQVVAVANGAEKMIGPFDKRAFNRPAGGSDAGLVYVDFSDVTSVTVALLGF